MMLIQKGLQQTQSSATKQATARVVNTGKRGRPRNSDKRALELEQMKRMKLDQSITTTNQNIEPASTLTQNIVNLAKREIAQQQQTMSQTLNDIVE